jgi:hypothetical protein
LFSMPRRRCRSGCRTPRAMAINQSSDCRNDCNHSANCGCPHLIAR